jgi:hypothetical protein
MEALMEQLAAVVIQATQYIAACINYLSTLLALGVGLYIMNGISKSVGDAEYRRGLDRVAWTIQAVSLMAGLVLLLILVF